MDWLCGSWKRSRVAQKGMRVSDPSPTSILSPLEGRGGKTDGLSVPVYASFRQVESTEAILLRKRKFSDTSLIVSWCTESLGCVQTIAKGARRQKSPFAGKLDLFFEAEISIVRSRKSDLHTLTEVVLKNPFAGIRSNYLRTQSAAYFVELIRSEEHTSELQSPCNLVCR